MRRTAASDSLCTTRKPATGRRMRCSWTLDRGTSVKACAQFILALVCGKKRGDCVGHFDTSGGEGGKKFTKQRKWDQMVAAENITHHRTLKGLFASRQGVWQRRATHLPKNYVDETNGSVKPAHTCTGRHEPSGASGSARDLLQCRRGSQIHHQVRFECIRPRNNHQLSLVFCKVPA